MKTSSARLWISVSVLSTSVLLMGSIKVSHAQQPSPSPHSGQFQTAEQHFKNIQVLKNIPADQLIPSMQFIAASLGVECDVKEYPDAGHAFMNQHQGPLFGFFKLVFGAGYHEPSAVDARARIAGFFGRHLR